MEQVKSYLRNTYDLSSYQVAQIFFLFKTISAEISKMIIMAVLFHDKMGLYLFALFIMVLIRSAMGGLHFYTYTRCLIASAFYLWLSVYLLPCITSTKYLQMIALLLCILICNYIGPVTSKYRPKECEKRFRQCKKFVTVFIFAYSLILYIMPESSYLSVGFWVIILHSLQLIVAKIRKKGEEVND